MDSPELAIQFQKLVQGYETILAIETGDDEGDEKYRCWVQTVICDIKSLLNGTPSDELIFLMEGASNPIGMRLH